MRVTIQEMTNSLLVEDIALAERAREYEKT